MPYAVRTAYLERVREAAQADPQFEHFVQEGREIQASGRSGLANSNNPMSLAHIYFDSCSSPSEPTRMWDSTWELESAANAYHFAFNCSFGYSHGTTLASMVLDLAEGFSVIDIGAGTGASLMPFLLAGLPVVAIEPATHFRALGRRVAPEALWLPDSRHVTPPSGRVLLQFCHVLNVDSLTFHDIDSYIDLASRASEVILAEASNSVRERVLQKNRDHLNEGLESQGLQPDLARRRRTTEAAGFGTHDLSVQVWVRRTK